VDTRTVRSRRAHSTLAATLAIGLVLLAPVPVAAGSRTGTWRGTTSQGKNVRFKVGADQRIHFLKIVVTVQGTACDIDIALLAKGIDTQIKQDGSFRVSADQGSSSVVVNGTFTTLRRATGTARMTETNGGCGDGTAHVDWKATRV
jgi:hypothetical protein